MRGFFLALLPLIETFNEAKLQAIKFRVKFLSQIRPQIVLNQTVKRTVLGCQFFRKKKQWKICLVIQNNEGQI